MRKTINERYAEAIGLDLATHVGDEEFHNDMLEQHEPGCPAFQGYLAMLSSLRDVETADIDDVVQALRDCFPEEIHSVGDDHVMAMAVSFRRGLRLHA